MTELAKDRGGAGIQAIKPGNTITVSLSTVTARSTQITGVTLVRVYSSVACFINFGDSSVEAVVTDVPIAANAPEYFRVDSDNDYIAGITASGSGTLYITPCE